MPDPKEFTPPASQEELDRIIADRLSRQESKIRGEFADYDDMKAKAGKFDEVEQRAAAAEKERDDLKAAQDKANAESEQRKQIATWADEVGKAKNVPAGLLLRAGTTKAELEAYADELKPHVVAQRNDPVPTEGERPANVTSEDREVVAKLFGNN